MDYRNELELIFYKLDGLAFQGFFNQLMSFGVPGFCPVRQKVDGGNDGFVQSSGTYYQVYAPEAVTSATVSTASSKIIDDFEKLAKHWHYIIKLRKYIFVYNDKYKGADKKIIERVSKIESEQNIPTEILTAAHLEGIFYELTPVQQEVLLAKHSISRKNSLTITPAIERAAELVSKNLSIEKWKSIDDQIPFLALYEEDIETLNLIRSSLFSMDFETNDSDPINNLVKSTTRLSNAFHAKNTMARDGERKWDNSWKRIYPHPQASYFDKAYEDWKLEVFQAAEELCANLNKFAKWIRTNHIEDYLNYQNYTITRLVNTTTDEFVEYIP